MKTKLFCLLFFAVSSWTTQAQVRVLSFEVKPQYLTSGGKIEIDNFSPTTMIQFDVTYSSFRTGANPNPGYSLTSRLATHNGSSRIDLSPAVNLFIFQLSKRSLVSEGYLFCNDHQVTTNWQ